MGAEKFYARRAWDALIAELGDVASRPFFRARLRASASERLAAGLRDFSFLSGSVLRPRPAGLWLRTSLFLRTSLLLRTSLRTFAPDHKNSDLLARPEASHAEFLVTGEGELRSLKHHKSSRIIAAAMIEALKAQVLMAQGSK